MHPPIAEAYLSDYTRIQTLQEVIYVYSRVCVNVRGICRQVIIGYRGLNVAEPQPREQLSAFVVLGQDGVIEFVQRRELLLVHQIELPFPCQPCSTGEA